MHNDDLLLLKGYEVASVLDGRERELIDIVRRAYEAHADGASSLPHSNFLRFPGQPRNRIIALPAYLAGGFEVAGVKWISSFPDNVERGLERASAVLVLNSMTTGRPTAVFEGAVISAKRTAASAALAAQSLHDGGRGVENVGLVGCGLINSEVARFILAVFPDVKRLTVFDTKPEQARRFKADYGRDFPRVKVAVAGGVEGVLRECPVVSLATTAIEPHIADLSACAPGSTVLHISLRDLSPEAVLASDNVVDDVDHVCRAQTSVHLAEQLIGSRDFIRCTLADVLTGRAEARAGDGRVAVFSPFGLGVLDVALGQKVYKWACEQGLGTRLESFFGPRRAARGGD